MPLCGSASLVQWLSLIKKPSERLWSHLKIEFTKKAAIQLKLKPMSLKANAIFASMLEYTFSWSMISCRQKHNFLNRESQCFTWDSVNLIKLFTTDVLTKIQKPLLSSITCDKRKEQVRRPKIHGSVPICIPIKRKVIRSWRNDDVAATTHKCVTNVIILSLMLLKTGLCRYFFLQLQKGRNALCQRHWLHRSG